MTQTPCAPLCRRARDTLTHRVYECPESEATVRASVPAWFWQEAQRAASSSSFWTTGICPSPVDLAPMPDTKLTVTCERTSAGGDAEEGESLLDMEGHLYIDGSCTTPMVRELARAGCSIVRTNAEGTPTKILRAAVPRHLPQTAQAGEYLAYGIVMKALSGAATITGDCRNVVDAANGTVRNALAHTKMYAGILLSAFADPRKRQWAGQIKWTRAHCKATGEEPRDVLRDIKGNEAADAAAKEAVGDHPPLGADAEAQLQFYERRTPHVVRAVIAALKLFPRAPGNLRRAAPPATREQAVQWRRHHWQFRGGQWRCSQCHDWLTARRLPRARRHQRCKGTTIYDDAAEMEDKGHRMRWAQASVPFAYCARCGAWGHRRTYHLSGTCGPPKASGLQALSRIRRGQHPMQRRGPGGLRVERETIVTTEAFCGTTRCWRRIADDEAAFSDDQRRCQTPHQRICGDGGESADNRNLGTAIAPTNAAAHAAGADIEAEDGTAALGELDMPLDYEMRSPAVEDMHEDFDVFGFGGSFDQPPAQDRGAGNTEDTCQNYEANRANSQARSAARGTMSIRKGVNNGSAQAAIARLMQGSRPPRADSSERMRALKKRIVDRVSASGSGVREAVDTRTFQGSHGEHDGGERRGGLQTREGIGETGRCDYVDADNAEARGQDGHRVGDGGCAGDAASKDAATYGVKRGLEPNMDRDPKRRHAYQQADNGETAYADTDDARASDANHSVGAACAGPGDPHQCRLTEPVTTRYRSAVVAGSVAAGGRAATLLHGDYARLASVASRGEAARGPPCDPAVSQDGIKGVDDEATWCASGSNLQDKHRGQGEGGTPIRRRLNAPLEPPVSLGVGPSIIGRALLEDDGGRPTRRVNERRRDGSAEPEARPSAARDRGGAAAAGFGEQPQGGSSHHTQGARKSECLRIKRSAGILVIPIQEEARGTGVPGAAGIGNTTSSTQQERPKRDSGRDYGADGHQSAAFGDNTRCRDEPRSRCMDDHVLSVGVPSPQRKAGGGEGSNEGTEAASSQGIADDGGEGAEPEDKGPPASQARHRHRRGPPLPIGPAGGSSCESSLVRQDVPLSCSSLTVSTKPFSPAPPPAPAAHPHLRHVRPRAGRAPPGAPGDALVEAQGRAAAAGSNWGHGDLTAWQHEAVPGVMTFGDTARPMPGIAVAHAGSGSVDEPTATVGPKRRRLRGKQAVGGCNAASQAVVIGAEYYTCISDRRAGQQGEVLHPRPQSAGNEAMVVAPATSSPPTAPREHRVPSGGLAAAGHGARSFGSNSHEYSASSGPSRFSVDTSTWQCLRAPTNRDGHELTARGASGDLSALCWRRRPPDR